MSIKLCHNVSKDLLSSIQFFGCIFLPALLKDKNAEDMADDSEEAILLQLKPSPANIMTDPLVYTTVVRMGEQIIVVAKGCCVGTFEHL